MGVVVISAWILAYAILEWAVNSTWILAYAILGGEYKNLKDTHLRKIGYLI
jgi:hypothetical protein